MPTNHTTNYNLSQWEPADQVRRVDFNADNAKIDAAIQAVNVKVDGKADVSALEALTQKVTAQETTLAEHTASMTKLGNCILDIRSYRGGGSGEQSFTFAHQPIVVFVVGDSSCMMMAYGNSKAAVLSGGTSSAEASLFWVGNTLTWQDTGGCNTRNMTYRVVALLNAAN